MVLNISIKGFLLLRPVARKSKCRVRILEKRGLPFIFNRYKKRKTFVAGAIVFIALIYILTSFVWRVEISGNEMISTDALMEQLDNIGVRAGVLKYKIDPDIVVNKIMLSMEELAWIGVEVRGTKVKIQVAERKEPPKLIPKEVPCNIVASKDGIINSIVVKDGQALVGIGDTVTKGQILVSGAIDIKNSEEKRLVHAIANIDARTWYEKETMVNQRITEEVRTGNKQDNYYVELFTKKFRLYSKKIKFNKYEKIQTEKRFSVGEDFIFPFALFVDTYYENHTVERTIDLETARQKALDNSYKAVMDKIPEDAKVIKKHFNIIVRENDEQIAVATIECLENIGETQMIGGE